MVEQEQDGTGARKRRPNRVAFATAAVLALAAVGGEAMLKRTPGVVSAEVSYEAGEANVEYDSAHTSREKIIEAITNMGYKATVKG